MKWLLGLLLTFVAVGLIFVFKWGVAPKPKPLVKPTEFSDPKQVGVLVYRRLLMDIRKAPKVVVGSLPSFLFYNEIWDGFLLAAQSDKHPFKRVYISEGLKPPLPLKALVVERWQDQDLYGDKVLIHGPQNWSTHFYPDSLVNQLENDRGNKSILSFTLSPFVISKDQLRLLHPPCPEKASSISFSEKLSCASASVSRQTFRKKLDPQKNWMALYQFGRSDYVLFIYTAKKISPLKE